MTVSASNKSYMHQHLQQHFKDLSYKIKHTYTTLSVRMDVIVYELLYDACYRYDVAGGMGFPFPWAHNIPTTNRKQK